MARSGSFDYETDYAREFRAVDRQTVDADTVFQSQLTAQLYNWWRGFAPNRPKRSDFDILEHRRLVPYLYLYKMLSPGVFEYRLSGEAVVQAIGHQQAGRVFSGQDEDRELAALSHYLVGVAESRRAHRCAGTLAFVDRRHITFESVDCPLDGEDGVVSHVVGLLVPDLNGDGGVED